MTIAYLRVSTDQQNLENQKGEITRYAQTKGISIDSWVMEVVSGKTSRKNRSLNRALRKLKKGDTLIVTELSRLSRTLHEIMEIMKICVDNNVTIYSTKDRYVFDDSINSKVLSFAFGLAAEIEHKLISQRTREAMALLKAEGRHMGRREGVCPKQKYLYTQKDEIVTKRASGMGIMELCKVFGVAYGTFKKFEQKFLNEIDEINGDTSNERI